MMVLSEEDKILIKNVYICKGYSARQLISATTAVCQQFVQDVDELKRHLINSGQVSSTDTDIQQSKTIDHWRVTLRECVPERGKHFFNILL